ncbi:Aste57867_5033 [Aphanomyces stellatus]|uniref:Aste57867_5033 protein n=1 Tax=Aphanomyces stellatus TaxID=120398 RepID=A0A485KET6_9STRA|nr:hypothetical protein As57867_005020 [Aphanomyces stellatus]VFT82114.1 Aste57867_5033 [Aphanomyces stellatus]
MVVELNQWDPAQYNKAAGFVAREWGTSVLALLRPSPGETILDLGCGDGVLTAQIADAGARVVGVDSSDAMVAHARATFGLEASVMDGQALTFDRQFDAVVSNAALHWMFDTAAIVDGVKRALKPGGRFVAECGGFGNIASIVTAVLAVLARHGIDGRSKIPWRFRTTDEWTAQLTAAGFSINSIETFSRQPVLEDGVVGWLKTFGDNFFDDVPMADRESVMREIESLLAWSLQDPDGVWRGDYIRVRFEATLA